MSARSGFLRGAVTALAVSALLVGCGGTGGTDATSGAATTTTSPADQAPPADLTVEQLAERTMAAQRAAGTVAFTMSVAGAGADLLGFADAEAVLDYSVDPTEIAMTASSGADRLELRAVGDMVYVLLPEAAGLPADTPWLVVDPEAQDEASRQFAALSEELRNSARPEWLTDEMIAADVVTLTAGDVEEIQGMPTRRYVLSFDVAGAADAAPEADLAAELEGAVAAGIETVESTLWLDGQYLPRRVATQVPTGAGDTATLVMTASGWGEPVTIEAPPADQTVPVQELLGSPAGG
jgi:hypothetical protein